MNYEINGGNLPVVELRLSQGESIRCQSGAMSWMSQNVRMRTEGGGLGKMFSRAFSGESMFQNIYTAEGGEGTIAFASSFPGNILAVEIRPGSELICQKSAFLAATEGVELSIFFQKKFGAGLFGGEGFIMQKLSGSGTAFVEIDGSTIEKTLAPGERLIADTGYLAVMDGTCSIDIETVKGVKNVLFGGEGLFNTVISGPGRVLLQSMPAAKMAGALGGYLSTGK
ncbi:MAG: TIGR00266 family protein [Eubacteriales bacterium]|nr:TIGR00266 family protein [Eubacteriales bacterium]